MVLLDFICIGGQKCGTKQLNGFLINHPDIYCPNNEAGFFNRDTNKSLNKFYKRATKVVLGKCTPQYCYNKEAISNIHSHNKDIKLILLIREPVARMYSQYCYKNIKRDDKLSFTEWVKKNKNNDLFNSHSSDRHFRQKNFPIVKSRYSAQIKNVLKKFPREQLHIGISERLKSNTFEEYNKILDFLGVEQPLDETEYNPVLLRSNGQTHNTQYATKITDEEFRVAYNQVKKYNNSLYELLGYKIEEWEDEYKRRNLL